MIKVEGGWDEIEIECQSAVKELFNNVPTVTKDGIYYSEVAHVINEKFPTILDYELKEITEHNAVHSIILDTFWKMKTVTLLPVPSAITRNLYWRVRSILFLVYIFLLVYHAYDISQTNDIFFRKKIEASINTETFGGISTADEFWDWLNNTFVPGLYDSTEPRKMMLLDDVLLRQTRLEPEPCSTTVVPNIDYMCYSDNIDENPFWKNSSRIPVGKESFSSSFTHVDFKNTFITGLSINNTIATERIKQLMDQQWIDWGTQMVAVDYLLYSPNSRILAAGLAVVEISSVGYFHCSSDLIVISEGYLDKEYTWSAVLLIFFLTGFILEELGDFILSACGGTTQIVKHKSEKYKQCAPCYLYLSSIWNVLDVFMIVFGLLYLMLEHSTTVDHYNLREVWQAIGKKQVADVFGSIALIMSFVRMLELFTSWEFVGILIFTILKMFIDIARFLIIFIVIVLGFTSAFHLSYSGSSVSLFADFFRGTVYVFTTTPSGYSSPDVHSILGEPGIGFALIFQIMYVFVAIILLLNLLIALMSDTYQFMNEQALTEFRWHTASALIGWNRNFALWPSPFSILHFVVGAPALIYYIMSEFAIMDQVAESTEVLPPKTEIVERKLYGRMVWNYISSINEEYINYKLKDEISTSTPLEESDQN
eukprot:TRINITY_DN769_c0_g2_i1.p1 TRINITY_DN769_c0_g2~~TRINITY_DN769_c0_g2_i1.p1  ORF type:complete len:744 (+),score=109.67 TRINITY_DN769_c0_g2_i1:278-2233(+)